MMESGNDETLNNKVLARLETYDLSRYEKDLNGFILQEYHTPALALIKQKIITDQRGFMLAEINRGLVKPKTLISLVLPRDIRNIFGDLQVDRKESDKLWTLYQIRMICSAATMIFRLARIDKTCLGFFKNEYIAIHNLQGDFCESYRNSNIKDLFNWYRTKEKIKNCNFLISNRKSVKHHQHEDVMFASEIFCALNVFNQTKFLLVATWVLVKSIIAFSTGKWVRTLLAPDAIALNYFQLMENQIAAKKYIFTASDCFQRPLWTYAAEQRGSKIECVFYSDNFESFTLCNQKPAGHTAGLACMTWPKIICSTDHSAKYLSKLDAQDTEAVGAIDLFDEVPVVNIDESTAARTIVVYDMPPYRPSFKAKWGINSSYYSEKIANKFINDIVDLSEQHGFKIAIKIKQEANKNISARYYRFLKSLQNANRILLLPSRLSPRRIASSVKGTIGFPFTSANLFSIEANLACAYYDCSGNLWHASKLAKGIPLLVGRTSLEKWLKELSVK